MDNIIIKNKTIKEEFNHIIDTYYKKIPSEYTTFVWMVLVNFKKNSNNEDFLVLILLYGLIFFKKINIDNEHINKKNREYIEKLKEIYKYATL
jgi:hypothetical protein